MNVLLEVNNDLSCSRGFTDRSSVSLLCVCAKVGQISPEVRLIACQKHFYDASKNINFAFEHCYALSIILIKIISIIILSGFEAAPAGEVFKVHLLQNFCSTLRT